MKEIGKNYKKHFARQIEEDDDADTKRGGGNTKI